MNRYVDPAAVLGPDLAKRVEPLRNGRRYVRPGSWTTAFAWLVDFAVYVVVLFVGIGLLAARDSQSPLGSDVVGLGVIALVLVVPLLYGMFYGNGRALGGLLTGTRLVRLKDGGRLGASAPWAMLVRVLLMPFLLVAILVGSFSGGTGSPPGSLRRSSIDIEASNRLWAAESAP
ncbi:RDD family protein [Kribbella amoyensis]|uniref:RDD family protein n=1 Tax=Kribbella amoyensis TaxID=996641 RepID=A0A561BRH0_9ACTN|nr:RDD family protein [Kribbella amoyensis]TWD81372.1 RDD family protein [Kribbella amoyensis]